MFNYTEGPLHGGIQRLYQFDNGYGASVIQHSGSYGYDQGLWELAVIKWTGEGEFVLVYDTGLAEDVIGHLTEEEVEDWLTKINAL